ncbi:MAG TPA: hypothetical protein VEQ66_09050 [Propionibacteriaceae bacterium]|nr:hypothetical protein [Propionibacteriaceae bacterium]
MTVSTPVETYDALHHALLRETGGNVEGLLVHIARVTSEGFQVIEVWESKELYDRCNREVLWPLAGKILGDQPPEAGPAAEEFEVRGLVVPQSQIAL